MPLLKYYLHQKEIWTNLAVPRSGMDLMKSIRLDPFQVGSYFYLFMALLGARGFTNVERGKVLLLKPMRITTGLTTEER
jgi:hypothetical protein